MYYALLTVIVLSSFWLIIRQPDNHVNNNRQGMAFMSAMSHESWCHLATVFFFLFVTGLFAAATASERREK